MKKDIVFPTVEDVHVVAVREKNEEFQSMDWNSYIINNKKVPLEMVLIVSRGHDNSRSTSTMRHSIKLLPAKSFAKIEFLQDDVLQLTNEFMVTFFEGDNMYEKKYTFPQNTIKESATVTIPVIPAKGIPAE